ncbi:MAG: signal peptide peptidase SppA [Planctomycetaceae bacterium]|nr:MAG: signal peptide peptidase SppA [Planctomycetaceae bacterium]
MVKRLMFALVVASLLVGGCSPNTGYVVKPIPLDEQLQETVITADAGWFVSDKIVVIDIDGLLMNQREMGFFSAGENPVSLFIEKMDKAQSDPNVKAVVLRINSPGGGVTASDIMYRRVMQFRKARPATPVVAAIEDVGASGGYYIACAADTIYAQPTSVTGSIGVIVQTVSFAGTMTKIGITAKAVTSGKYKDMGSPLKELNPDDQAVIQGIVDEFYAGFLKVVADGRKNLSAEQVAKLADGRVYTGRQAKELGLVDTLGYVDDAVMLAKKRIGPDAKVRVVMYHRPWGQKENYYSKASPAAPQLNLVNINVPSLLSLTQPQFLYLWTGGQ